jgi:hypothetical protein
MDMDEFDENMPKELAAKLEEAQDAVSKIMREVIEWRLSELKKEPKCPECWSVVLRPKCFYELGGNCPRHEIVHFFGGSSKLSKRIKELK